MGSCCSPKKEEIKYLCKIMTKDGKKNGSGFFMRISDSQVYLITNYHILNPSTISQVIYVELHHKNRKELKMKNRYIKSIPEPKDITIIEINNSDDIFSGDISILECDLGYIEGYNIYKNQKIYLDEPLTDKSLIGEITNVNNFEFEHNIPDKKIAPGNPIIIKMENTNTFKAIGINKEKKRGTFIGEIINEMIDLNNYIKAEMDIKDNDINRDIRIINSYEEQQRIWNINEINPEHFNEEQIKSCEISINDNLIPTNYFFKFSTKGKYIIKYKFRVYLTKIDNMFCGCNCLTNIDFTNFKTKNVTDMSGLFYGCKFLTNINFTNFNTQKVTDMSNMFDGCTILNNINLSNFKTNNVTDMSCMFDGCKALTTIDLSNFNTEKVTDMSYIFNGCSNLTNLNLTHFNTENVTNMGWMFSGCAHLTNLDLSYFNTKNVNNMNGMFDGCISLAHLNVTNFDTQNVFDMNCMFSRCKSLKHLNLGSFDTQKVTDMNYMFDGCISLTQLNVSKFNTEKVSNMNGVFDGCDSLRKENIITKDKKLLALKN